MPHLSSRAQRLPASPIRKLAPFAEKAKQSGTHVFHLNIGQPDIPTPPEFFQAITDVDTKVLAYSPSPGIMPLREEIQKYYDRHGYKLNIDDILVTTGASEALNFIFSAILNPGEEVIVPEPFYANYQSFSLEKDAVVVPITTSIDDDFALPPMAAFEEKITDKTKAILICNPGNPTGVVYPESSLQQLREICLKHDLYLISDEVYREFTYDGPASRSVLALEGMENHAIVVDSISKRFSACGARIGNVVSRNNDLMDAILKMAQARLSPPTFGQIGATAAYGLPESFYQGVVKEYKGRRDAMLEKLSQIPGVKCPKVGGAFYAVVQLPVEDAEDFCQWILEDFSHQGCTVMMAPAEGFYCTPGLGKNEVRIAYVLEKEELVKAIDCLAAAIEAYSQKEVQSV